jgi:hypothetical protein
MVADPDDDPHHPILPDPYSWEVIEFTYRRDPDDWRGTYIDLLFARDGVERRLRFFAPREVEIPRGVSGVMGSWCRVYVADVRARQMEGIGVRVGSFEPDWCVPSFWAASVIEVAEPSRG